MSKWNKTGKIKSFIILVLCALSIYVRDFDKEIEIDLDFYITMIPLTSLSILIFFPLSMKLWSLIGSKYVRPSWNESPITFNPSKSLNFFQFIAYWFMTAGLINILLTGIINQQLDTENTNLFVGGLSLFFAIKLGLKWSNKGQE